MKVIERYDLDYNRSLNGKGKAQAEVILVSMRDKVIEEYFQDLEHLTPKIVINNRITSAYGRYNLLTNIVEISGYFMKASLEIKDLSELEKTVKHELAHWFLYKSKKDYRDGDETFEKLLAEIGASSSGAVHKSKVHCEPLKPLSYMVEGECEKCGVIMYSGSKTNGRFLHKDCGGLIVDKCIALVRG